MKLLNQNRFLIINFVILSVIISSCQNTFEDYRDFIKNNHIIIKYCDSVRNFVLPEKRNDVFLTLTKSKSDIWRDCNLINIDRTVDCKFDYFNSNYGFEKMEEYLSKYNFFYMNIYKKDSITIKFQGPKPDLMIIYDNAKLADNKPGILMDTSTRLILDYGW